MTETGIWSQEEANKYHASSPKLAAFLCKYLDPRIQVYDFGCGTGYYLHELSNAGFHCIGIEGSDLNNFLHDDIRIHDLTKSIELPWRGNVLSFETGEHLPEYAEQTFLDTITNNCGGKLIVSWATPGQGGIGHVNLRTHEYIINEISKRGFQLMNGDTEIIRQHVDKECDWLERNLLVFERLW